MLSDQGYPFTFAQQPQTLAQRFLLRQYPSLGIFPRRRGRTSVRIARNKLTVGRAAGKMLTAPAARRYRKGQVLGHRAASISNRASRGRSALTTKPYAVPADNSRRAPALDRFKR